MKSSNTQSDESKSARHNFLSIYYDTKKFLHSGLDIFQQEAGSNIMIHNNEAKNKQDNDNSVCLEYPIVANERCGTWYAYPYANAAPNTHFKSTDGHKNIYNFSLKRMNFNFLSAACKASSNGGAIFIVDASKTKCQPDSFSRTLPIWCCVLNRITAAFHEKYSNHQGQFGNNDYDEFNAETWDTNLYTPPNIVSDEENNSILEIIPCRLLSAIDSGVIINEAQFMKMVTKPLRCFWISNDGVDDSESNMKQKWKDLHATICQYKSLYTCIICVSVSESGILENIPHYRPNTSKTDEELEWFYYRPGAADDHEFGSWSKGLTPKLFWKHCDQILFKQFMTIQDTDDVIKQLMKKVKEERFDLCDHDEMPFDAIGKLNISIGSRISGRPPLCWNNFDAILNVSELEYEGLSSRDHVQEGKFYLQLNVKEGKKDRAELEKWMAVALFFIGVHAAASKRRVLVHCAKGMDRSVAVVLAAICLFCELRSTTLSEAKKETSTSFNMLEFHQWTSSINVSNLIRVIEENQWMSSTSNEAKIEFDDEFACSGLPKAIVKSLLGRRGRDLLFHFIRDLKAPNQNNGESEGGYFANKESMRVALMAIKQFRDKACPSRSTMQKLNRFFMSNLDEQMC